MSIANRVSALALAAIVLAAPAAHAQVASAMVSETTRYDRLIISEGAVPAAPEGKTLTLTVDDVETALIPGIYEGDVVLSVAKDIPVQYREMPTHHLRAALYVKDGAPVWEQSVKAAIHAGEASKGSASRLDIRSAGPKFNGVIVTGEGKYTLDHPIIDLTGNGGNDFAGYGAAVMATGKADVTLERPIIRTNGAIRNALFIGGEANVTVNDAEIVTYNGTLPEDYKFTVELGAMMEVPWVLGLQGNVRTVNLVDSGTLTVNRSHIRSQGWGVMSTDEPKRVRMNVTDSVIEVIDSGYGTYSIGDSINTFSRSIIRSPDIGAIMAVTGSLTLTDRSFVNAGTYGVMMHSGIGGGTLTIDKGSEIYSARAAIEVKGIGTNIVVDDAHIESGEAIILQVMANDDPILAMLLSGVLPEGMTAFPPGLGPDAAGKQGPPPDLTVTGRFTNAHVVGDFYNANTARQTVKLSFESARLESSITTANATHWEEDLTPENWRAIGHVWNTPAPTETEHGMEVTLGAGSHWTVTDTSYLTKLVIADDAVLDGPGLEMTVDGVETPIAPGTYAGAIALTIGED